MKLREAILTISTLVIRLNFVFALHVAVSVSLSLISMLCYATSRYRFQFPSWYVTERDEAELGSLKAGISGRLKIVHQLVKALEGTASIVDERNALP